MKITANKKERLDKYLADEFQEIPRTKVKDFIKENLITVNEQAKKPSSKLEIGDEISISDELFKEAEILPEHMDLKVVFENAFIFCKNFLFILTRNICNILKDKYAITYIWNI